MTEQTETTITMATASDAGCWIDGHWGQYANARLCEIALENGWNPDHRGFSEMVARKLASIGPSDIEVSEDDEEVIDNATDAAEEWLNDHVAPEGYAFGWFDGEFFLSRNESIGDGTSWEEVDDLA